MDVVGMGWGFFAKSLSGVLDYNLCKYRMNLGL